MGKLDRYCKGLTFEVESLCTRASRGVVAMMQSEDVTQAELAYRTGQTQQGISRILSGDYGMTLRTLARLAHAMGYRVELTFSRIDPQ